MTVSQILKDSTCSPPALQERDADMETVSEVSEQECANSELESTSSVRDKSDSDYSADRGKFNLNKDPGCFTQYERPGETLINLAVDDDVNSQ